MALCKVRLELDTREVGCALERILAQGVPDRLPEGAAIAGLAHPQEVVDEIILERPAGLDVADEAFAVVRTAVRVVHGILRVHRRIFRGPRPIAARAGRIVCATVAGLGWLAGLSGPLRMQENLILDEQAG